MIMKAVQETIYLFIYFYLFFLLRLEGFVAKVGFEPGVKE